MKMLVCGGRDYANKTFAFAMLDRAHEKRAITMVISGGAKGADALGEAWAAARGVHCAVVAALWDANGKAAGPMRNAAMLTLAPDGVIAFPGGTGTDHMVHIAKRAGIRVWEPSL